MGNARKTARRSKLDRKRRWDATSISGLSLIKQAIRNLRCRRGCTVRSIVRYLKRRFTHEWIHDKETLGALLDKGFAAGMHFEELCVSKDGRRFTLGPCSGELKNFVIDEDIEYDRLRRRRKQAAERKRAAKKTEAPRKGCGSNIDDKKAAHRRSKEQKARRRGLGTTVGAKVKEHPVRKQSSKTEDSSKRDTSSMKITKCQKIISKTSKKKQSPRKVRLQGNPKVFQLQKNGKQVQHQMSNIAIKEQNQGSIRKVKIRKQTIGKKDDVKEAWQTAQIICTKTVQGRENLNQKPVPSEEFWKTRTGLMEKIVKAKETEAMSPTSVVSTFCLDVGKRDSDKNNAAKPLLTAKAVVGRKKQEDEENKPEVPTMPCTRAMKRRMNMLDEMKKFVPTKKSMRPNKC